MRTLLFTSVLLLGLSISGNALNSGSENPVPYENFDYLEYLNNEIPQYSCKIKVKMSMTKIVGVSAECEGGGTSSKSASDACRKAMKTVKACMEEVKKTSKKFIRDVVR